VAGLPYEELYPTYDHLSRQNSVGIQGGFLASASYSAAGQVTQIQRGGTDVGSALTFTYNAGTRDLLSLDETTQRGTAFTREAFREYTRNAAGIITKAVTTSPSGTAVDTQCFTYGALQELTGVRNGQDAGGGLWWSSPDMVGTVGMQINNDAGPIAGTMGSSPRRVDPEGSVASRAQELPGGI